MTVTIIHLFYSHGRGKIIVNKFRYLLDNTRCYKNLLCFAKFIYVLHDSTLSAIGIGIPVCFLVISRLGQKVLNRFWEPEAIRTAETVDVWEIRAPGGKGGRFAIVAIRRRPECASDIRTASSWSTVRRAALPGVTLCARADCRLQHWSNQLWLSGRLADIATVGRPGRLQVISGGKVESSTDRRICVKT